VRVLFQHGQFAAASTALTTRPLLCYSLGLPAFAAVKLIVPVFYSLRDTSTPVRAAALSFGVNVILNIVFLVYLARSLSNAGPALATTAAAYANFGTLFVLFRNRFGRVGATALLMSLLRSGACAIAMGAACLAMLRIYESLSGELFLARAGGLAAMIAIAVVSYMGLAWILRCDEVHDVAAFVRSTLLAGRSA